MESKYYRIYRKDKDYSTHLRADEVRTWLFNHYQVTDYNDPNIEITPIGN